MSDSHLYMAMDLITGGNLAGGYRCDGEEQAAAVVRQIVRALRYLHDRNIAVNTILLQNRSGETMKTPPPCGASLWFLVLHAGCSRHTERPEQLQYRTTTFLSVFMMHISDGRRPNVGGMYLYQQQQRSSVLLRVERDA